MFIISTKTMDLKDYTAVIPGLTYGSAGQLAIDLLIASTKAHSIGRIWIEGILPIIGKDAFGHNTTELTVASEIFVSESHKSVFLQIRGPIEEQYEYDFRKEFTKWMIANELKLVVILASASNIMKYKSQLEFPDSLVYTSNNYVDQGIKNKLTPSKYIQPQAEEMKDLLDDPGTRLCMNFLPYCEYSKLGCILFVKYCAGEGDTRPHAIIMAKLMDQIFDLFPQDTDGEKYFIFPTSWVQMFGGGPPKSLY